MSHWTSGDPARILAEGLIDFVMHAEADCNGASIYDGIEVFAAKLSAQSAAPVCNARGAHQKY